MSQLKQMNASLGRLDSLQKDKAELTAQLKDLEAVIKKVEEKSGTLGGWPAWLNEKIALEKFEGELTSKIEVLNETAAKLPIESEPYEGATSSADFIEAYRKKIHALSVQMKSDLKSLTERHAQKIEALKAEQGFQEWKTGFTNAETEYQAALAALTDDGVDPAAHQEKLLFLETTRGRLLIINKQLEELDKARKEIRETISGPLTEIWIKQFEVRKEAAATLNEAVPLTATGTPTVQTAVTNFGDVQAFIDLMSGLQKDQRRVSSSDWSSILRCAFAAALEANEHPILMLERWIKAHGNGETEIDGFPTDVAVSKLGPIAEWMPEEIINKCLFERIPDSVVVTLHRREDGKEVGALAGRTLSAGQKSTTVLSLILAAGTEPIIIDQPEDDLDNEFVYQQLVPILRTRKETRQIIVVSHNANIPVNGDAELIVPLAVIDSKGSQKLFEGEACIGALDRPQTQAAVELILEGSAEAFRRRQEKYGF